MYPVLRHDGSRAAFTIRPFSAEDRGSLEAFYLTFEPKRAAQGLPPHGASRIGPWLDAVLSGGIHLLAFRGPELIGHALLVPTAAPEVREYAIFLRADERGRGVGTELNRVAVEAARHAGVRRLWLSAEPHNRAAIRSYEKAGFRFRPATIFSSELEMELDLAP